jgi:hypothetical protein
MGTRSERRIAAGPLGAAYAVSSAWMFWQEREMRRSGGPGIVGLELAGRPRRVDELANAQLAAAACDVGENTALLAVLGGRRGHLPAMARACAALKFSLLGAGAAYVAIGMSPKR